MSVTQYRVVGVFKDKLDRITDLEITRELLMKGEQYRHTGSIITVEQAIRLLENKQIELFTEELEPNDRKMVYVKHTGDGRKYLTTSSDEHTANNLDALAIAQF